MMKHTLKVGDSITRFHNSAPLSTHLIRRVTKTLAFIKLGEQEVGFPLEVPTTFKERGANAWSSTWYELTTDEHRVLIHDAKQRAKLSKTNWNEVPAEKIEKVLAILQAAE